MSRRTRRLLPGIIAIVALAAVYGLATVGHPVSLAAGSQVPQPRSAPVSTVQFACPMPGQVSSPGSGVALVAAPATTGSGRVQVSRLTGTGSPLLTATQPGKVSQATVRTAPPLPAAPKSPSPSPSSSQGGGTGSPGSSASPGSKSSPGSKASPPSSASTGNGQPPPVTGVPSFPLRGGITVQASGSMARGLAAEQTAPGRIPAAPCGVPGTDFWFIGPGAHAVGQIRLYLANPSGQAADANVEIATDAGPLQSKNDTGITVPPHGMVAQSLARFVPGSRVISLHVRTSVGQVVAAVQEITGGSGTGAWLPPAQLPVRHLVVPGLPPTAGTRQLFLAVPGIKDAHVTISAVTSRGTYEPTGGGGVDVPAGSGIEVTLPALSGIPAAIKLESSVPITATAMVSGGLTGAPGTMTAAVPPIQEQGVVPGNIDGGAEASALILSAPGDAAQVKVTVLGGGNGGPAVKVVKVKAHRSKVVGLSRPKGSGPGSLFSVVVTPLPGSGPVYAGRLIMGSQTGTAQVLLPVQSTLTTVPLPPVSNTSVSAGR